MTNRNDVLAALAAEIRASLGNGTTASTRRRWAIEIEALASAPSTDNRPFGALTDLYNLDSTGEAKCTGADCKPRDGGTLCQSCGGDITPQPAEGDCPRCGCVDNGECLCPTWWAVSPQPDGGDEVECPHCVEGIQPMTFNRPCLHCKGLGVMPNE